jgi:hypothetical protein
VIISTLLISDCSSNDNTTGSASVSVPAMTATNTRPNASAEQSSTVTTTGAETIYVQRFGTTAWESKDFEGSHKRVLSADDVLISMQSTTGGFDASFSGNFTADTVDEVSPEFKVAAAFNQEGEGEWWYGPKISVNWTNGDPDGMAGWYENYIIETATDSPSEMHARLLNDWEPYNPENRYLGETQHDGSVYKHYLVYYSQWVQYWAVRQDYRNEGTTSIYPILQKWRQNGLSNLKVDGVKFNVETHGPNTQVFYIKKLCLPDSFSSAECS